MDQQQRQRREFLRLWLSWIRHIVFFNFFAERKHTWRNLRIVYRAVFKLEPNARLANRNPTHVSLGAEIVGGWIGNAIACEPFIMIKDPGDGLTVYHFSHFFGEPAGAINHECCEFIFFSED